jgi:WD40 repeat protein
LADDLAAYLAGEPIRARPVSATEKAVKWVRRRPAAAGFISVSGIALLALVALSVGAPLLLTMQKKNQEIEEQQGQLLFQLEKEKKHLHRFGIFRAELFLREGNLLAAAEMLRNVPKEFRDWEWFFLDRRLHAEGYQDPAELHLRSEASSIAAVCFARDSESEIITLATDGAARLCRLSGPDLQRTLTAFPQPILCTAISPGGPVVAAASLVAAPDAQERQSEVSAYSVSQAREILRETISGEVQALALPPDGTRIAAAIGKEVVVWSLEIGKEIYRIPLLQSVIRIAFALDGRSIAGVVVDPALDSDRVLIWNTANGSEAASINIKTHANYLGFSPNGRLLVEGEKGFEVWDVDSRKWLTRLTGHHGRALTLAFNPSGTRVAVGSDDGLIIMWDWRLQGRVSLLAAKLDPPNEHGWDRSLGSFFTEPLIAIVPDDSVLRAAVTTLHFDSGGEKLVAGYSDGSVRIWHGTPQHQVLRR